MKLEYKSLKISSTKDDSQLDKILLLMAVAVISCRVLHLIERRGDNKVQLKRLDYKIKKLENKESEIYE